MTSKRNMSASVRQRLLNLVRIDHRPFNELLQYYAMERFLYRLSQSDHVDRFILKGALMLRVWRSPELRPTMDIDLLGRTSNEETDIVAQIRDILTVDVETDGLAFDPGVFDRTRMVEGLAHLHIKEDRYGPALVALTIKGFLTPLTTQEQRIVADLKMVLG